MEDERASKVALGLEYARDRLNDQFERVNQIQTTLGVLLGFVVTTVGLVFEAARTGATYDRALEVGSLSLLLGAAGVFGFGLALFRLYRDPEEIRTTVGLDDPSVSAVDAQVRLMGRYLTYYHRNKLAIRRRFLLVNLGIAALLAGIALFALGALTR